MTIREIAKQIGVSPAAVSFVLNNRPGVNPEKRHMIKKVLLENGYTLKNHSPSTSQHHSDAPKHIKFVKLRTRYQNDDFAACILDAVEQSAKEKGFHLSITNMDHEDYRKVFSSFGKEKIDGIIFLASSFSESLLDSMAEIAIPLVYIDFENRHHAINTVNADHYHGTFLAVRHLLELGHTRIGYLRCKQRIGCLQQRFHYFKQHLTALGGQLEPDNVIEVDMLSPHLEDDMCGIFAQQKRLPTAFVADNDTIAASCLYALQRRDIKVPQDISIIGFDNAQISSLIFPRLTTIDVNIEELGRSAVERLQALMRHPQRSAVRINVSVNLVERESTAPCAP